MIAALTFDFWNTLYKPPADQTASVRRALDVQRVLAMYDYHFSIEEIRGAFKEAWGAASRRQRTEGIDITPEGHLKIIREKLNLRLTAAVLPALYNAYTQTLLSVSPQLNDEVLETLPVLAQNYSLAVICNTGVTPGKILRQIMQKDQIDKYFGFLVFSDEVGFSKPSEKIFRLTLDEIGARSNNSAHIGDDALTDIQGAKRAGMSTVWLAPDEEVRVAEADYHISRVGELLTIF